MNYSGDKPLCEALQLMHREGISSIAVVDNHSNVIGNISTVDVKVCVRENLGERAMAGSLSYISNTASNTVDVTASSP